MAAGDYPRSLRDLEERFATEADCRAYLWSLRWPDGFQANISAQHLDFYLDEFTFRFNRRRSRSRGKLFERLFEQAVALPPAPYKHLVGGILNPDAQT